MTYDTDIIGKVGRAVTKREKKARKKKKKKYKEAKAEMGDYMPTATQVDKGWTKLKNKVAKKVR